MGIVTKTLAAWTRRTMEPEAELVVWLNVFVALGTAVALWFGKDFSVFRSAIVGVVLFLALMLSLLNVYTSLVTAVLGIVVAGCVGGLMGASLGLGVAGPLGAWIAGLLLGSAFAIVSARAYWTLIAVSIRARVVADTR